LEDVGVAALLGGHRIDDRHLPLDHAIVEIGAGDLLLHLGDARDHSHQPGYTADLLHLLELIAQIGEIERALAHLLGDALRPFGASATSSTSWGSAARLTSAASLIIASSSVMRPAVSSKTTS